MSRSNAARSKNIKSKVKQNSQVIDVFSTEQLIKAWEQKTGKETAELSGVVLRDGANYASAIVDSVTAVRMIKDLGINGRVSLKTVGTKQYVIFKGYAGIRSIFSSTRYLATNPKVVDMAIGRVGVNNSIVSGARLTIFLVVPLNILNHILSDQQTMTQLIGKTATDLVKVGVAAAIASLTATAVAAATTLVAGPLIVVIIVGLAVGLALDALDKQFGVTDALIKAMDKAFDSTVGEFARQLNKVERHLRWQAINGMPVGRGIFY